MDTSPEYQNRPPIDMRPAQRFADMSTAEIVDLLIWASEIIADDIKTGDSSMIEVWPDCYSMHVRTLAKALRFQLGRREWQGVTS